MCKYLKTNIQSKERRRYIRGDFPFVFSIPDIHAHLTAILAYSDSVRLKIETEQNDSKIPWELLHNGLDFLTLSMPVARTTVNSVNTGNKEVNIKGVLVVAANPKGDLDEVEREGETIRSALEKFGSIEVRMLSGDNATKDGIIEELETGKYQVLHYSGHSIFNELNSQLSYLLLEGERPLYADELARLSINEGLQMVFLNSCSSSRGSGYSIHITSIADAFIKARVPYVIGMKWAISDKSAFVLATEFYRSVLELKDPVEALQRARIKVGEAFDWGDPAWAAPIIYI